MHVTRAQPIRNVLLCRFKANKSVFNLSLLGTERDGLFVSFGSLEIYIFYAMRFLVASLGLVSHGLATDGVTLFFLGKNSRPFLVIALWVALSLPFFSF